MGVLNRARINILRKPVKTFILFFLIIILGTMLSGAISIRNAIINAENSLRAKLPAVASLYWDWEAFEEAGNELNFESEERLTAEMVIEIGQLSQVKGYDFSIGTLLFSRDLKWAIIPFNPDYLPENVTLEDDDYNYINYITEGWRSKGADLEQFYIKGINNPDIADMEAGQISLASGRIFTQDEIDNGKPVAVISRTLAEENGLSVGSTINFENIVSNSFKIEEDYPSEPYILHAHLDEYIYANQTYELEVIGIFDVTQDFYYSFGNLSAYNIKNEVKIHNQIYVSHKIAEEIQIFETEKVMEIDLDFKEQYSDSSPEELIALDSLFILNDSRDSKEFIEEASKILPEFWEIQDFSDTFRDISSSMDSMLWIANIIFWGTAGATIIILSLLITLFLKDRKHEIGIYMALGEDQVKIISQILLEVLFVASIATVIALFLGNIISKSISTDMIQQEVVQSAQTNGTDQDISIPLELIPYYPGEMTTEEMIQAYDASLDIQTMTVFLVIGLGVTLLSTVIPILYVLRINPKKILM